MIASHDSYTYQKAKNPLMNLISIFWKCQKLDIQNQYDLGVRIFDVRVYKNNKGKWGTAHGTAHFKQSFDSIVSICEYFKTQFPGSFIRIYLEDNVKNNNELKELFLKEADEAFTKYFDILWEIGTHVPWITYYRNPDFQMSIKEYYCHLFNWNTDKDFIYNLKNIDWSSWCLPLYAKKHNPIITQEMINDPNIMYLMDYVGIYPKGGN